MKSLTEQERQELIDFLNAEIARIQRKKDLWEGDKLRIASHLIALSALTAEPVAFRWEGKESGKVCCDGIKPLGVISQPLFTRAAPPAPSAPEGWKMVPVEPTKQMLEASYRDASVYSPTAYRAMLSAAPEPPSC